MKHYKNETNEIFAYEDDFEDIPEELEPITDSEKNEILSSLITTEEKIKMFRAAVGVHIDNQARNAGPFGFDNIISAVSYADDTKDTANQPYGAALKDWRRECWNKAREILGAWQAGGDEPTLEEVISQMPEFVEPK